MITRDQWQQEQAFEQHWWDDCRNTFAEQAKHVTYARRMGLVPFNDGGRWPLLEGHGQAILDVGGGPVSMLLEVRNLGRGVVVDPCAYPAWTMDRYIVSGIEVRRMAAEDYQPDQVFDEAWCYNVLQHTHDPGAIVAMMRRAARTIRMFEWVEFPPSPGHPHELHADTLREWLGGGDGWTDTSNITWDLNVDAPVHGGRAFHGYVATGL